MARMNGGVSQTSIDSSTTSALLTRYLVHAVTVENSTIRYRNFLLTINFFLLLLAVADSEGFDSTDLQVGAYS